ncbi:MAG: hypothetical protein N2319_13230 [Candidatus Kapabacteria bacterium]|nr:hypothetical protein [Candidatus Kapabacteria bacterium]
MNQKQLSFIVIRLVAIVMLSIALLKLPYGYYTLMRLVLCFSFCFFIYINYSVYRNFLFYPIFGLLAIIYNPVFPLHLGREVWTYVNLVTILTIIISFFVFKAKKI